MVGTQLSTFVNACQKLPKWQELEYEEIQRDGKVAKPKGYVNGYQFNEHFVKPWTAGTGCSVALLMNMHPRTAELMLSHSWAEDMLEVLSALRAVPSDKSIWFCICANYQAEDGAGPSIEEQLAKRPFEQVIKSVNEMGVIHTTRGEVYDRLWCVYEIDVAVRNKVALRPLYSSRYLLSLMETLQRNPCSVERIKTKDAECTRDDDRRAIVDQVQHNGGFED